MISLGFRTSSYLNAEILAPVSSSTLTVCDLLKTISIIGNSLLSYGIYSPTCCLEQVVGPAAEGDSLSTTHWGSTAALAALHID